LFLKGTTTMARMMARVDPMWSVSSIDRELNRVASGTAPGVCRVSRRVCVVSVVSCHVVSRARACVCVR
jgi:hypothetical protein